MQMKPLVVMALTVALALGLTTLAFATQNGVLQDRVPHRVAAQPVKVSIHQGQPQMVKYDRVVLLDKPHKLMASPGQDRKVRKDMDLRQDHRIHQQVRHITQTLRQKLD
jgi:hypothetical protein